MFACVSDAIMFLYVAIDIFTAYLEAHKLTFEVQMPVSGILFVLINQKNSHDVWYVIILIACR